jgi:NAD(P)H dehydrogenase (quinone)
MIAITGANGQLGRLVLASLLKTTQASDIIAIVRDPAKLADLAGSGLTIRQADYDKPETWPEALKGVTKLLLISSSAIGQRARQHAIVIDAAAAAGVDLLVYTSLLKADTSPIGLAAEHRDTEAKLKASGLPHVLLRNGWYIENYSATAGMAVTHGAVIGSSGDGRIAAASRADFAEAAAKVLTSPDSQAGRVYELAGDDSFTMRDYAATLSNVAGKPVVWTNLPQADYAKALQGMGLPEPVADMVAAMDVAIGTGAINITSTDLSRLLGRPTTRLDTVLKAALA